MNNNCSLNLINFNFKIYLFFFLNLNYDIFKKVNFYILINFL
jgi:hypothetical protein